MKLFWELPREQVVAFDLQIAGRGGRTWCLTLRGPFRDRESRALKEHVWFWYPLCCRTGNRGEWHGDSSVDHLRYWAPPVKNLHTTVVIKMTFWKAEWAMFCATEDYNSLTSCNCSTVASVWSFTFIIKASKEKRGTMSWTVRIQIIFNWVCPICCCKKSQIRVLSVLKKNDRWAANLWIFRFLYAYCESMSWCEVASISVACGKARGLQQTLWRCKSQAMLAWLCRWRGFTPECEKAWGGQSLVSQKTPYSGCPSFNCVRLQNACQNKDFFWWRGFKWVVALTVINGLVHRIWNCPHKNYKPR